MLSLKGPLAILSVPGATPQSPRIFLGRGPFTSLPYRIQERPAFYVNDFFGKDPHPWKHPVEWLEFESPEAFLSQLSQTHGSFFEGVEWSPLSSASFFKDFTVVQTAIEGGVLRKGVPATLAQGRSVSGPDWSERLLRVVRALVSRSRTSHAYVWSEGSQAMFGLSPELLFERESGATTWKTLALAGTKALGSSPEEFLNDSKERFEHQAVIEDITKSLKRDQWRVWTDETRVYQGPGVMHLKTEIAFRNDNASDDKCFERLVNILHPTAALGVLPRSEGTQQILRKMESAAFRNRFGAPFGVEIPDGRSKCLVAIRNLQRDGDSLMLGAGCGVVSQSSFENEWREMQLKMRAATQQLASEVVSL